LDLKSKLQMLFFEQVFEVPLKNGLFRPTKTRGSGIKMVNMKEIFEHKRIKKISMELVPMSKSEKELYLLKNHDLLFARQSLVYEGAGKCCIIDNTDEELTFESHLIRARINKNKANPWYLFYFFDSKQGKMLMDTIKEETAATGIRGKDLAKLQLSLPGISSQQIISNILWTLDTKANNLQTQNKILEQTAYAIFKSWFVDFDGQTEFEDSELGHIPKGWKVKKLIDEISVTYGFPFKSELFNSEKGVPIIRIRNIDDNFSDTLTTEVCNKKFNIFSGDIITGMDGEFNTSVWLGEESLLNQRVCKLFSKNKILSNLLILFLVKQKFKEYEEKILGTTVIHLSKPDIEELKIIFPSDQILKKYNEFSESILQKLIKNQKSIFLLRKIHDSLLPKLMSGDIRV